MRTYCGKSRHIVRNRLNVQSEARGWTRQIADGGPTMTEFLQQQPDFTGLVGCFRHMAAVRSGVLLDDVYGSGDNLAYYWVPPSE